MVKPKIHVDTIDKKHTEHMKKIRDNDVLLHEMLVERKTLLDKLNDTKNNANKVVIDDLIRSINKKITKLGREKNNYLLNNSKYLHNYFESKKSESQNENKVKIINSFFSKHTYEGKEETKLKNGQFNENVLKYDSNKCKCGGEMVPIQYEGIMVCKKCGIQKKFIIEHEKVNYNDTPKDVCFYAYRRINHFREILAQFQAKETTQISNDILIKIKNQIKKERLECSELTNTKCKDILNKLGLNKYYEHVSFIKDKLGIKPPVMSPQLEEKLCNLFVEIEKQYAKYCPSDRVNFLNYYYVLYKLCELLNETYFLPYFPMLKDPVKRIEQDVIWKKICRELNWRFIPII
jgi:hypothetical protein